MRLSVRGIEWPDIDYCLFGNRLILALSPLLALSKKQNCRAINPHNSYECTWDEARDFVNLGATIITQRRDAKPKIERRAMTDRLS